MRNSMNSSLTTSAVPIFFCVVFVLIIAFGVYDRIQHQALLRAHGCLLNTEAPTGHYRLVGKVITPEYVYVYECTDGLRTEIR